MLCVITLKLFPPAAKQHFFLLKCQYSHFYIVGVLPNDVERYSN